MNYKYIQLCTLFISLFCVTNIEGQDPCNANIVRLLRTQLASSRIPFALDQKQEDILMKHPLSGLIKSDVIKRIQVSPSTDYIEIEEIEGEHIQSIFIQGILRSLGYQKKFKPFLGRDIKEEGIASLYIIDSAEAGRADIYPRSIELEMSDVKMANGRMSKPDRRKRTIFNIPEDRQLTHLYMNTPFIKESGKYDLTDPDFIIAANEVFKEGGGLIILSSITKSKGSYEYALNTYYPEARKHFDKIVYLSELISGKTKLNTRDKKVLILNDTTGLMPQIHSFSDQSLITGPINFYESLYSGVKTNVLINDSTRGDYDKVTMDKLLVYAEDFPNFRLLRTMSDFSKKEVPSKDKSSHEYDYETFERLLDIIYKKLLNQKKIWK